MAKYDDEAAPEVEETEAEEIQVEETQVGGRELLSKVKQIIHEGNVRRIVVTNDDGRTIIEFPVTVGVVGALVVPPLAAVAMVAAVVTSCTIHVERKADADDAQ
jgi:hypothetical protein